MMHLLFDLITVALLMAAVPIDSQEVRSEVQGQPASLAGAYKITSGISGGRDIPDTRLNGRVRITDDRLTIYDLNDKEAYVADYTIEGTIEDARSEQGARITMTSVRSTREDGQGVAVAKGRIRMLGTGLMLVYDHAESADYPRDFATTSPTQNLFVMERLEGEQAESGRLPIGDTERP